MEVHVVKNIRKAKEVVLNINSFCFFRKYHFNTSIVAIDIGLEMSMFRGLLDMKIFNGYFLASV